MTATARKRLLRSPLRAVVSVYFIMVLYAFLYGDKIIFQPQPSSYRDTGEIIKLHSGDGVEISAVHLHCSDARYTILYSHGNAEDIGHLRPVLEGIRGMGFSVFAYDYRGYGTSSGTPSEKIVYQDADAAYDYLTTTLGIPAHRIVALGRSLGGAVAIDLAARRRLGGLIIESSFVTAYRVITHVPLLPFDKFTSLSKMGTIRCPVLVIHGKKDEVIPFWHGKRLFDEANEPKLYLWVEDGGHNNLFEVAGNRYEQILREFVTMIQGNAKSRP